MKQLIIVRHGDTFLSDDIPRRIGRYTDLPLVDTVRPRNIGRYLKERKIDPDRVYAAPLKRTMQTAQLIIDEMNLCLTVQPTPDFIEINYGVDENKTEEAVILRLGKYQLAQEGVVLPSKEVILAKGRKIMADWNRYAKIPHGWRVDADKIINMWRQFAGQIIEGETVLVVSSNGVIRFAPHILDEKEYANFLRHRQLKVKTGSIAIFNYQNDRWRCDVWNKRPDENVT